ncbi:TerD family protein [Deinococcus sp. AJ005]|uniref:TerD family protein n=1 Tax=Deinococcus sp. AJ005 TaxID=2652443 RepID=UPI00125CC203|nr:TerD family protein [Deinococcus sp. AJ005]QFP75036.1 TerD family protein [Deinococcus sp. AJ005]
MTHADTATTPAPRLPVNPAARAEVLLRRLSAVEVGGENVGSASAGDAMPPGASRVLGEVLAAGALPTPALIDALNGASSTELLGVMQHSVAALRAARGAAPSLPQLRNFARSQVLDTGTAFLERLGAWYGLEAQSTGTCALRGNLNVLSGTWSPAVSAGVARSIQACSTGILGTLAQGACAVCHLRVGDADELMRLALADRGRAADRPLPARGVDLAPGGSDLTQALLGALANLAASTTPLSETERNDLITLSALLTQGGETRRSPTAILDHLIGHGMPQREVRALVVGTLIAGGAGGLLEQLRTSPLGLMPVDLLRILDVWGGGGGTLARPPISPESNLLGLAENKRAPHVRVPRLSRPQRREVLGALNGSLAGLTGQGTGGQTLAWEAVHTYPEAFKRVLARLHVHEAPQRFPHVAALAGLLSAGGNVGQLGALHPQAVELAQKMGAQTPGERARARSLLGGVELALAGGELGEALALLLTRPGLLARSLDRLLRLESGVQGHAPQTLKALKEAAPRLTAVMLLSLHAHLAGRGAPDPTRVFRSRGKATTRALGDTRMPLTQAVIGEAQMILEDELLRRGAAAPALDLLEIEPGMLGVRLAPSARAASNGNEGLAPGSRLPLTPVGAVPATTARLFVHWAEQSGAGSIDLDLSAMAYDVWGQQIGMCSYSSLRQPGMVHSGDLRSAPLPVGATEYVDLDLAELRASGATLVLASVYSFTSVPFSKMARASCGVMSRADVDADTREMDLGTVRLKFGLSGEQTSCLLLAVDLTQPGREEIIFLELAGDKGGYRVIERDGMVDLGAKVAQAAQGVPLVTVLAPHIARAQNVRCGANQWRRGEGEARENFARRVSVDLRMLAEDGIASGDADIGVPQGPALLIADQPARAMQDGDQVICLSPGVSQPAGVHVSGLKELLNGL